LLRGVLFYSSIFFVIGGLDIYDGYHLFPRKFCSICSVPDKSKFIFARNRKVSSDRLYFTHQEFRDKISLVIGLPPIYGYAV